ncbi:MAG: sensor histidine kinase [Burkholderiales bacterium]|nr:sensor histidine kinase [Burkholderiales bacterium]
MGVANHFAGEAFDRAMLDDAYALAANVKDSQAGLSLGLTPREMGNLLYDQTESVYFAVFNAQGALVAGHGALKAPVLPQGAVYQFDDIFFQGRPLRTVTLRRGQPDFTVVLAQTTISRRQLLHRLLVYSAVPQVLLLLSLAWWLRRVIQRDLDPLAQLQQAVDQRDASDLAPVPQAITSGATTRDVERLGLALNSMLLRLEQSIAAQREFAGNVAHELRTPLAGIRAQAGYALGQADAAVWREQLQGIAQGERRASHLVDQLLALARADEGSAGLRLSDVVLSELACGVLLRFMAKADAAGVDLGGDGLDEPIVVRGDPGLIEGMLGNLLDNALRYGVAEHPRVTVGLRRGADAVVLSVNDNGPGIEQGAGELGRRWVQGAAGQKLGQGAGLGLAIVSRYAELLGASFTLEPAAEGRGLCAAVSFPAAADQASAG